MNPFAPVWRAMAVGAIGTLLLCGLDALDQALPPPLEIAHDVSAEVVDRDGLLLRAFATSASRWRLRVDISEIDAQFVDMLIAYEDQRFWSHPGIDPIALVRAALQLVTNGRIVSGGSTISMQLARLLEPRESRSISAKFVQILRALQIERRLTKSEILELYLTLAPYGGNLEGIRAASLAYFGREPRKLTTAQAALLVALPQSPERRRPDRNPRRARQARDRVLVRIARTGVLDQGEIDRAVIQSVPHRRRALPALAAHLSGNVRQRHPGSGRYRLTLTKSVQLNLEVVVRDAAVRLGDRVSIALIMADARSGEIIAQIGSADFFNSDRAGWVDMTAVARSPGSALKPFIYGLAFEEGLVAPETIIEDRPTSFAGYYRPRNFDMTYQGDISIRQALQMSLNVPAIRLLDAVGPTRLMTRFRRAGVSPVLPRGEHPGLAIGLGGLGITLKDLVQLYTAFPNGGRVKPLFNETSDAAGRAAPTILLQPIANWHVADILSGVAAPDRAPAGRIAYKTGTSYGYRDAWSIGFDGRYVIGVWVGRADGGSVPGLTGRSGAAPVLFDAFAKSGLKIAARGPAPAGAVRLSPGELPIGMRRFVSAGDRLTTAGVDDPDPRIVYPPQGARMELGQMRGGRPGPLVIKLQGGHLPFRWLANGRPLPGVLRRRTGAWTPDGRGYSSLTVIDAKGRAASVAFYIE